LAEFLLDKEYKVFGTFYDKSTFSNLNCFIDRITLFQCDIRNYDNLKKIIGKAKPNEIYHLAAISFIPASLENPKITFNTNLYGTLNLSRWFREQTQSLNQSNLQAVNSSL